MGKHLKQMTAAALAVLTLAAPLAAQTAKPGVVVELYTSQGCSSCPPADALLSDIADDPGVIALALHVDYWDYLGWADDFARPQHTDRQKAYAKAKGSKMLYTPQMVIDGSDILVGTKPAEVAAAIARHAAQVQTFRLSVTREGDRLVIRAEAEPPSDRKVRVQLVRFRPEAQVDIERGENAGHRLTYRNIVTAWDRVAEWQATRPYEAVMPVQGADGMAVILQAEGMGEILAAAALR
jgi:hypothetical protein